VVLAADQPVLSAIEIARQLPAPVGIRVGMRGRTGEGNPPNGGRFSPWELQPSLVNGVLVPEPVLPGGVFTGESVSEVLEQICDGREGWEWRPAGNGFLLDIDFESWPKDLMRVEVQQGGGKRPLFECFNLALSQMDGENVEFTGKYLSYNARSDLFVPLTDAVDPNAGAFPDGMADGRTLEDVLVSALDSEGGPNSFFVLYPSTMYIGRFGGGWEADETSLLFLGGNFVGSKLDRRQTIREIVHGLAEGDRHYAAMVMLEFHRFAILDREGVIQDTLEELAVFDSANYEWLYHRWHPLLYLDDSGINAAILGLISDVENQQAAAEKVASALSRIRKQYQLPKQIERVYMDFQADE
jgi:hypothetical protein